MFENKDYKIPKTWSEQFKVNPLRLLTLLLLFYFFVLPLMVPAMIYYPIKENTKAYEKVKDFYINTSDNEKINAWYVKAKKNKPTVVFCHGNGGNISYYEDIIDLLSSNGYGIILFDYRGYGKSSGSADEDGLYKDLNAVVNYLVIDEKIPKNQIVLWGLSLGGAVVTEIASKDNYKAVILQSTFTNIRDEAISKTQLSFPKNIVMKEIMKIAAENLIYYQKYDTASKIVKIKCPMLIAHSKNDKLIPYKMSITLAKINPNAKLYISNLGGHNEHSWFDNESIKFLNSISGSK